MTLRDVRSWLSKLQLLRQPGITGSVNVESNLEVIFCGFSSGKENVMLLIFCNVRIT